MPFIDYLLIRGQKVQDPLGERFALSFSLLHTEKLVIYLSSIWILEHNG